MTLTLDLQGKIRNWLYLCEKWSDCHETKSKHIDWTLGLKCDHQILPWPWPWPWIFKVKYEICYISAKSGPIATKWKANISIWTRGLKYDNGFDLGHDLDVWIFKVICDLDHLVTKVKCKDLPDSDQGDFRCRRAVDSSSSVRVYISCSDISPFIWSSNPIRCDYCISNCTLSIHNIPWNMYTIWAIHTLPNGSEATLKNMGKCTTCVKQKYIQKHNKTKHNKTIAYFMEGTVYDTTVGHD